MKTVNEKLRQNITECEVKEKDYQSIIHTTTDGFWIVDSKGRFLDVNDAYCALIGYSREELLNMSIPDIEAVETSEETAQRIQQIIKTGHARFETHHRCKDGRVVDIEISTTYAGAGDDRFFVFARDITRRKQAEEALRESREELQKMFESVTDGIIVIDLNGVITEVNQRTAEMHGFGSKDELLGKSALKLIVSRDHDKITNNMKKAIKQGTIRGVEYTLLRVDGTEFPGELSTSVLKDTSGNVVGHITIARDITRRKQAEKALRESEEKYKELAESITEVFFAFDKDLRYTYWNKASEELTGISAENALGKHLYDIFPDSEMTRKAERIYLKALRTQQVQSFVNEYQLGGKDYFFEISAYPSRKGLSVFFKDITERKRAEEEEQRLQQELYLARRLASLGELAAGVAHEVNNPLTGILGFAERLLRKSNDEEASQDLEIIHNEAQRAARVVQNLLTFARRREPKKEYSNINDILQKALELRAYVLQTSSIEVITDLAPSLPEIMVDFPQIQEVFLNIILNAEQAMNEAHGGGELIIKTREIKDHVRISFADDGPGIPPGQLDKVFDPFFTTRAEKGGTGLGLSACHGIVTEHGGRIYGKSKPEKGATFFVELPLSPIEATFVAAVNIY